MKKIFLLVFTLLLLRNAFPQDIIYKKDGEKIRGKIIEVNLEAVNYKSIDDLEGASKNIPVSLVSMIKYENGKEEIFKTEPAMMDKPEKFYADKYFSIAAGYGQSYGGLGGRLQGRTGKVLGFGYHAGVGYVLPKEEASGTDIFYYFGLKFFWYKAWYLNLQYGPTAIGTKSYLVYNHNTVTSYKEKIILFGPSLLIGGDWFFNEQFGLNGALGVATNLTNDIFPVSFTTMDFGFIYKF